MRPALKTFSVICITAAITIKLFLLGLSYPLQLRLLGDAHQYLNIANQFDGFSAVWTYSGLRSIGLPFLEFLVKQALLTFTPAPTLQAWVDTFCVILILTHVSTVWLFSRWAQRKQLVNSENATLLLFAFLATYPAFIGHTTAPLTDTLAVDLALAAVIALEAAFSARNLIRAIILSGSSAFLFGALILVRPGSLIAIGVAVLIAAVVSVFGERRKILIIGITVLGSLITVSPFALNCGRTSGEICLQSMVPNFSKDAQSGLAGARTLWSRGYTEAGLLRTLPDETMVNNYASRCELKSLIGTSVTSFTGCLLSRPHAIPAFVGKKWIGLFDHFRFTPYLENHTPAWLRWLSRAYDSLAWVGLALIFYSLLRLTKRETRTNLLPMLTENITPTLLTVYSLLMLGQHTIMHVEDRYGLPVIPLCATVLIAYGERALNHYRSFQWRTNGPLLLYCCLAWTAFIAQIIAWDNTV